MANLVNSKVVLGVFVGLVIGIAIHISSAPGRYTSMYQNGYDRLKSNINANAIEIEVDPSAILTTIETEGSTELEVLEKVLEVTNCKDVNLTPAIKQRGDYWVLYNYIVAEESFHCYETVTYTTQGDYTFLDNLIPLVKRWQGPISVALYAPGEDFHPSIDSVIYLRNCETDLIRKYVTFHIFFEANHTPKQVEKMLTYYTAHENDFDCDIGPPYVNVSRDALYKSRNNLTYPINVGRNVARETVQTHFVFASDIELYPTRNLIPKFLQFVATKSDIILDSAPKVFVLPIYEIIENERVPENKTELQVLFRKKRAFLFHGKICPQCHSVPKQSEWIKAEEGKELNVFSQTKRVGKFQKWEAFYIGTNAEPLFDERLSWEGQSNKMTQGFAMCLMDYTYMVLDNAFIIHKPGIKKKKVQMQIHGDVIKETNKVIKNDIKPQLELMYGKRRGCFV